MAFGSAANRGGLLRSPNRFPSGTDVQSQGNGVPARIAGSEAEPVRAPGCCKAPPAVLYYHRQRLLFRLSPQATLPTSSPHFCTSWWPCKLPCVTEYLTFYFLPTQFYNEIVIATSHWSCSKSEAPYILDYHRDFSWIESKYNNHI